MEKTKLDFSTDTLGLPESNCCECGHILEACAGPRKPLPGDCTLCGYCGCLNVFDGDLRLRKPTDDEIFAVAGHPTFQAMRRAIIRVNEKKAKHDG